jgi:NADP-dependent 3-hydroxy acid dehydrogenase YdfG
VHTLDLDVTRPDQVESAAALAADVSLLVNNAGIATMQPVLTGDLATCARAALVVFSCKRSCKRLQNDCRIT